MSFTKEAGAFALTLAICASAAATLGVGPAAETAPPAPLDAHAIVERMAERNPTLRSYSARVHVDVRMLNFPWLAPKLDGTSYFKRPDFFVVIFDRMPGYARGFQRIFDDVGSPRAWEKDQNITIDGTAFLNGRQAIVLRLTKKIHSDILDHTLAYVDPTDYALLQMEWYYTSGGKITMSQQYRTDGVYSVLSQQHAAIDIPHVRAVADATYGVYQINVPVQAGSNAQ
jgi:outer membrane lipoprotein-sorting protein